jgi:MOSC domain-containing protein YiiM
MTPGVLSVSVGLPRVIGERGTEPFRSGIGKRPVAGPVAVDAMGIAGDGQADLINHGGLDKAVYAYDRADAAYWENRLGRALPPGTLGENLTLEGLPTADVRVGDRLRAGDVLLEVTQPRVPCYKLGIHMGDAGFPAAFAKSLRVGFYLRVVEPGMLANGIPITIVQKTETFLTIAELMGLYLNGQRDAERLAAAVALPGLSAAWREELSARLALTRR